jgi:hypothetical protein
MMLAKSFTALVYLNGSTGRKGGGIDGVGRSIIVSLMAMALKKYSHSPHVTWRQVEKDAVVLDLRTSVYCSLNEVGVLIWEAIGRGQGVEAIRDKVCQTYDITPKAAQRDIEELIADLLNKNLIVES